MVKYLVLILVAFSQSAFSDEKYLIYLGGGGEPKGPDTIFDSDVAKIKEFIQKSNWKSHVSFNGGHSKTEETIDATFKNKAANKTFTKTNFEEMIKDLKNKIENGSIKPNDQILINIDSHGGPENSELKSHEIFDNNNEPVSLDMLEEIIITAKEKKLKLAIIDNSCYSGTIQKLNFDNSICTISLSGQYNLGRGNIGSEILNMSNLNKSI